MDIIDLSLQNNVWNSTKHLIPSKLDGGTVVGLQPAWRHGKYHAGQSVFAHIDFWHYSDNKTDNLVCSRISLTIYLHDSFAGGDTAFVR